MAEYNCCTSGDWCNKPHAKVAAQLMIIPFYISIVGHNPQISEIWGAVF